MGFAVDFRPIGSDAFHGNEPNREIVYDNKELVQWYNSASYVACTSLTEGTPNYLIEAAACGCVPVSTAVGAIREFGQHAENCVVIPQRDVRSFIKALELARRDRIYLSRSVEQTMQSWGYSERAEYFFEVFRRLIEGHPVKPFSYADTIPDMI